MFIDINNNQLDFDTEGKSLSGSIISQLVLLGFKKQTDLWVYEQSNQVKEKFHELIDYLDYKSIDYQLSKYCEQLRRKQIAKESNFLTLKAECKKIKDGEVNASDFNQHKQIMKKILRRGLRDHQVKASYHLFKISKGANFSVPGAGKTTVVLAVFERLKVEEDVNLLFVVGPPACFGPWKNEFKEVLGRNSNATVLAGGNKVIRKSQYANLSPRCELVLTTFQTLLNDFQEVSELLNSAEVNAMLVIDESHYFKRVNGSWANAVLEIAGDAKYKCVLTGTPMPNSYSDLFNLFDFLWPDNQPISEEDKAKINLFEKEQRFEDAKHILDEKISPLFYRVRKNELGLEPPVFHEAHVVEMNQYERLIYDAVISRIREYEDSEFDRNIELVDSLRRALMIRLRQCYSYIGLLEKSIEGSSFNVIPKDTDLDQIIKRYSEIELPSKLEKLSELVLDFNKRGLKVIVWSNFLGTINLIEKHFKSLNLKSKKIIGETPVEKTDLEIENTREKIRDEFVDENSGLDILLANPAACAESISLHKTCFHAIYYDLSYNCAQYLQSLDRIHRVGGSEENEANYYFLQYGNTLEGNILARLKEKEEKMKALVDVEYSIYSLDMSDLVTEDDDLDAYKKLFVSS